MEAPKTQLTEGDKGPFKVTAAGKTIDADIYIGNDKLNGATHTFEKVGAYAAVAKKANYKNSESLKITVTAPNKK